MNKERPSQQFAHLDAKLRHLPEFLGGAEGTLLKGFSHVLLHQAPKDELYSRTSFLSAATCVAEELVAGRMRFPSDIQERLSRIVFPTVYDLLKVTPRIAAVLFSQQDTESIKRLLAVELNISDWTSLDCPEDLIRDRFHIDFYDKRYSFSMDSVMDSVFELAGRSDWDNVPGLKPFTIDSFEVERAIVEANDRCKILSINIFSNPESATSDRDRLLLLAMIDVCDAHNIDFESFVKNNPALRFAAARAIPKDPPKSPIL